MTAATVIDARGHRCPVPTLRLRKAMDGRPAGERLVLLATDPMARIDAPYLAAEMGATILSIEDEDGALRITVETGDAPIDR